MIRVELSDDEITAIVSLATRRKLASARRRSRGAPSRQPEHYDEIHTWDQEIESAAAENAVCKWRNRYWTGSAFNPDGPGTDAGKAQVRWTQHSDGHLIIYGEDKDDDPFVLVTGRTPVMAIVGWIYGRDAKVDRFWRTNVKCPSWWVPQSALRRISSTAVAQTPSSSRPGPA